MGSNHSALKDLLSTVSKDQRLVFLDETHYEEVVELATTSFVGTDKSCGEGLRWVLGPENRASPPSSSEKIVDCIKYRVQRFTKTTFLWGCAIGYREEGGEGGGEGGGGGGGGQLSAVALLFPPGAISNGEILPWYRALWLDAALGWQSSPLALNPQRYGEHAVAREQAFLTALESFHGLHAAGLHWYVNVLAVHPAHQAKGRGRMLLETVMAMAALAQPQPVPVFLECFASKGQYYSKWMEVASEVEIANPDTRPSSDGPLKGYAMLYTPPATKPAGGEREGEEEENK